MEIKWLEDFLSLCETGSFRNSANQRFVSQPAFSRRIRALESWVGVDLVDRSSFPVQLTEAGKDFRDVAKQIIMLAYQVREDLRSAVQQNTRMVTIATHPSLAVNFVPQFLQGLESKVGKICCRIRNDLKTAEFYLTSLEQGTCDFLICYDHDALTFLADREKFLFRIIGQENLIPVVAPEIAKTTANDSIPLIKYAPYTHLGKIVEDHIKRYMDKSFKTVGEASVAETLKAMAVAGQGVAWLPKSNLLRELEDHSLALYAGLDDITIRIKIYRYEQLRDYAGPVWQQIDKSPEYTATLC